MPLARFRPQNSQTLARRIDEAHNRPSGFDYMRISLSCSIVVWHLAKINYGNQFELALWNGPARPLLGLILPMFFALSGFLVAASYARCETVASFLFLRMIRIFPALAFETMISAFVIGPLFTTLTLPEYFSNHLFFSYFLNIFGDVHYYLPGVFADNPSPNTVNGQLWTVPFELRCYLLACILSIFGVYKNARYLFSAFVVLQIIMLQRAATYGEVSAAVPGNVLVLCFLAGFILFRIKGLVRVNFAFFILAIVIHILLYFVTFGDYCVALPDAYITIYLGTLNSTQNRAIEARRLFIRHLSLRVRHPAVDCRFRSVDARLENKSYFVRSNHCSRGVCFLARSREAGAANEGSSQTYRC